MCPALPAAVLLSTHAEPARERTGRRLAAAVPQVVSGFAGVWNGVLYRDEHEAGVPFSLLQNVVVDARSGGAVGHVAFATNRDSVAAEVRLLEASATTYVALVGPYYDADAGAQVVALLEARRAGDRMWGSYQVRAVEGGYCVGGSFVAVKARRAAAA